MKQVSHKKTNDRRLPLTKKTRENFSATYKSEPPFNLTTRPLLIILSGPSGAGKDTVLARMKELGSSLKYITTVTTRSQRANERNNLDYHFISIERFQEMIERKELLERANVYGNWYGIPKEPVKQALDKGHDVILKIDIQGAATLKKIVPQAVFIFLLPSSMEELAIRLKQRRTESTFDLALRIRTAEEEIKQLSLFDYVVLNKWDEIDQAVSDIKAIIDAEKCRVISRQISL